MSPGALSNGRQQRGAVRSAAELRQEHEYSANQSPL